jgi:hypothetical protein
VIVMRVTGAPTLKYSQKLIVTPVAAALDSTIAKFERGEMPLSVLSVSTIKRTLEGAGVEFPEGEPGVRLRKGRP